MHRILHTVRDELQAGCEISKSQDVGASICDIMNGFLKIKNEETGEGELKAPGNRGGQTDKDFFLVTNISMSDENRSEVQYCQAGRYSSSISFVQQGS